MLSWMTDLDQITSGSCCRRHCVSAGIAALGGGAGGGAAAGALPVAGPLWVAHKYSQEQRKATRQTVKAQREAAAEAAEAQRAAVAATPNKGGTLDASAVAAATQRRRGVQSTYLASRLQGGGEKLGD